MRDPLALILAFALAGACAGTRHSPSPPRTFTDPPAGQPCLLVDGSRLEIKRAIIRSRNNANDEFTAYLEVGDLHDAWHHVALWMSGRAFPIHSWMCGAFCLELDRDAAVQLGEALGTALDEREDPGHRLSGRFEVVGVASPERVPLRFHLLNTGHVSIQFRDGGRNNNALERDDRFSFEIERNGSAVGTTVLPSTRWASASGCSLAPGEERIFDLELTDWASFAEAGTYSVHGRYEIEIRSEVHSELYESYSLDADKIWDDVVESDFEFRIGG